MKSIQRTIRMLAATVLAAAAFLPQAQAAPVVSVSPVSQTIGVGGPATVNIIVSGLTDPTGGFSLTLGFTGSVVSGASFLNDPGARMGADPLDISDLTFGVNSLNLFFVADVLETQASLAASEGASFTLATLTFTGLASGLSALTLSDVVLSNWNGTATLAGVTTLNGEICVEGAAGAGCAKNVPEPGSLLLVATAMFALALRRRQSA